MPRVTAIVHKKFPPDEMRVLAKFKAARTCDEAKLQYPNGSVTIFKFDEHDSFKRPDNYEYGGQMYLADAPTAEAVDAWMNAREIFKTERDKRLTAYKALIAGAGYVEDIIELW